MGTFFNKPCGQRKIIFYDTTENKIWKKKEFSAKLIESFHFSATSKVEKMPFSDLGFQYVK